jgi:hypothetical protein
VNIRISVKRLDRLYLCLQSINVCIDSVVEAFGVMWLGTLWKVEYNFLNKMGIHIYTSKSRGVRSFRLLASKIFVIFIFLLDFIFY